jgi:hypothetical protein
MQISPGSAMVSSRAATLTPSLKMSPFDYHVAEFDADVRDVLLEINGAAQGFRDALELDEHAVAGGLDDAAPAPGDRGIDMTSSRIVFGRASAPASSTSFGGL